MINAIHIQLAADQCSRFLIQAIMSVDMTSRVSKLISRGERRESKMKTI